MALTNRGFALCLAEVLALAAGFGLGRNWQLGQNMSNLFGAEVA